MPDAVQTEFLTIEMGLFKDVARIAAARLTAKGYEVNPSEKPEDLLCQYFNARRRRITPAPRKVFIAAGFICPPVHAAVFQEICRKAEAGEDLRPHQSRKITTLDYNDGLLNHWDIQHLHLSLEPDPKHKGLLKGTPEVLFARITDDAMYCVAVAEHVWTKQEFVRIIHETWPETLRPLKGRIRGERLSDEQIGNLRRVNANVAIEMEDGTVYASVGGGYLSSGMHSLALVFTAQLHKLCGYIEGQIRSHVDALRTTDPRFGSIFHYRFSLVDIDETIYAYDEQAQVLVRITPALLPILQ
jgi:hypothetical protein